VPHEYFPAELSTEIIESIRGMIQDLKSQGAVIVPISLPSTSYALSSYYVLASAEASSNLARYDGIQYGAILITNFVHSSERNTQVYVYDHPRVPISQKVQTYTPIHVPQDLDQKFKNACCLEPMHLLRSRSFTPLVLPISNLFGQSAFDNYFLQAQRVRQLIQDDFDRVFAIPNRFSDSAGMFDNPTDSPSIDVILHPSAIRTAPPLSEDKSDLNTYVQDTLTVPASLARLPALSVPSKCRLEERQGKTMWPVGLGLVGQWGTDQLVLAVGKAIEALQNTR
jgi:aspartyl-tRNA(Asn)/glutamyl-tRNA(Gln) amidotransferase subunit A